MEQHKDISQMLDLLVCAAFAVKDGIITAANQAAQQYMISTGTAVSNLLVTGKQEYADFEGGCLYLTLKISGAPCGASVSRMKDFDVFILEQNADQAELQAMALAAQELRNPLSNIMITADNLFPLAPSEDGSANELTARINRGLYQMHRIICNMSDAYRYSKTQSAQLETRDICAVLDEQIGKHAALLENIDIHLEYAGLRESIYCLTDAEKLERAVSNMLTNAAKFTPQGGTIHAKLSRNKNMLYLTVQDNGPGIPDKLLNNVYRRYQRQPGIEDGRYGIGLGMVLIRATAAIHGGTVLIQTGEQGTKITMTMAIRQNTDSFVRSTMHYVDYAGERDHGLIELSEILPAALYSKDLIN